MFNVFASQIKDLTLLNLGYKLSDEQVNQFCVYGDLLLEWNQKLNLTRIIEPLDIILKHFIDSMAIEKYLKGNKLADIGTGAGFPGLPIKILRPELDVILVDSLKKRLDFLDVVISKLKLKTTRTVHARAEDFGRNVQYRGTFDCVSSRAVARLPILLEYSLPILKKNGLFISLKGLQAQEELKESQAALNVLGGNVECVKTYNFGETAEHRAIIVIKKGKETPSRFPRKAGIPAKSPIH
ncbi:ribosomal RNA small subunit methyltransferase G [Desulfosporosinus acididurans]|uniref:Ribosomal RNA small subunit methyltransferase G n=1 Tax=Desulfosporosinus acididurans TaxID=476652 RepID=A0A0J1FUL4_9FIRM|nr:16S rRNA (guanine(527)-N(7))-methyltransferase RsmG [Desulfosporosinus acididurans]KLU67129.1 ribosomal RNA small subunit methyltransferase G [Desulfosporosinus acididurans]